MTNIKNRAVNIYTSSKILKMDSAYWGLGSTKKEIFIGLCTHNPNESATVFSFNRKNKKIKKLFSLSDIIIPKNGELPQGKIHTPLFSALDGNIYFGTHFAYPFGRPQPVQFEGGHLVYFNPKTLLIKDLGIPIRNEGVLTLILDPEEMIIYGLSAPSFKFFSYNIRLKKYVNFGPITNKGSICRSLVLDNDGNVYGSFENNHIFKYNKRGSRIEYLKIKLPSSHKIIKEWKDKSRRGVNYIGRKIWRSAVWHEETKNIYGIHAEESSLFSFDPKTEKIKKITSMGEDRYRKRLNYVYPTLSLAAYKNKIFYAPVNGFFDYSRSVGIIGNSPLISFDVKNNKKINHGSIISKKSKVYGVAGSSMTGDGILYLLGAVEIAPGKKYNKFNVINGKGFGLGLIEIDTNKLKYD